MYHHYHLHNHRCAYVCAWVLVGGRREGGGWVVGRGGDVKKKTDRSLGDIFSHRKKALKRHELYNMTRKSHFSDWLFPYFWSGVGRKIGGKNSRKSVW
jgi:hypothetical protein